MAFKTLPRRETRVETAPKTEEQVSVSNIQISRIKEVYQRLERVFGDGKVIIIGGRAANILNSNDARFTHDLDTVMNIDQSKSVDYYKARAEESGFKFKESDNFTSKFTLEDLKTKPSEKENVEIDVHYGEKRLSGIRIRDIISTAKIGQTQVSGEQFVYKIVDVNLLILMKFKTWLDRGDKTGNKDARDIVNLLWNHYGSENGSNVDSFVEKLPQRVAGDVIEGYFKWLRKKGRVANLNTLDDLKSELVKMKKKVAESGLPYKSQEKYFKEMSLADRIAQTNDVAKVFTKLLLDNDLPAITRLKVYKDLNAYNDLIQAKLISRVE